MKHKGLMAFSLIFSLAFFFTAADDAFSEGASCVSCMTQGETEPQDVVILGGNAIGVSLCTDGVLVVATEEITTADGAEAAPAKNAGIRAGDMIQSFNGTEICSVECLCEAISKSAGKSSSVMLRRDQKTIETLVTPQATKNDGDYRIGAWVKDTASGIGTLTYYDPQTGSFAALGHGICDSETGEVLSISRGSILAATVVSVQKGEKGVAGELSGVFKNSEEPLGKITLNCETGIYGTADPQICPQSKEMPVASREETKIGSAVVLANVEGGRVEEYAVEIIKIFPKVANSNKGMIIKVTDSRLLEKTGGIVQGMSGSPIIQNGKLVGAVTHVFLNDPQKGYGIFIENMLEQTKKSNGK